MVRTPIWAAPGTRLGDNFWRSHFARSLCIFRTCVVSKKFWEARTRPHSNTDSNLNPFLGLDFVHSTNVCNIDIISILRTISKLISLYVVLIFLLVRCHSLIIITGTLSVKERKRKKMVKQIINKRVMFALSDTTWSFQEAVFLPPKLFGYFPLLSLLLHLLSTFLYFLEERMRTFVRDRGLRRERKSNCLEFAIFRR